MRLEFYGNLIFKILNCVIIHKIAMENGLMCRELDEEDDYNK